jgi:hypothetical protein
MAFYEESNYSREYKNCTLSIVHRHAMAASTSDLSYRSRTLPTSTRARTPHQRSTTSQRPQSAFGLPVPPSQSAAAVPPQLLIGSDGLALIPVPLLHDAEAAAPVRPAPLRPTLLQRRTCRLPPPALINAAARVRAPGCRRRSTPTLQHPSADRPHQHLQLGSGRRADADQQGRGALWPTGLLWVLVLHSTAFPQFPNLILNVRVRTSLEKKGDWTVTGVLLPYLLTANMRL